MGYLIGLCFGLGVLSLAWSGNKESVIPRRLVAHRIRLFGTHKRGDVRKRKLSWPDVVDDVASGIKSGLSLPQAVFLIGDHGPIGFRESFSRAARLYVQSGNFTLALNELQRDLADPIGDRFVVAIKVAHEIGGSDLGSLMRALAESIREDLKLRGELEARQSWTINGARLAVAAPWVTAAVLSLRSNAIDAYSSPSGMKLLFMCLLLSVAAYRIMLRIGRLPLAVRVFT